MNIQSKFNVNDKVYIVYNEDEIYAATITGILINEDNSIDNYVIFLNRYNEKREAYIAEKDTFYTEKEAIKKVYNYRINEISRLVEKFNKNIDSRESTIKSLGFLLKNTGQDVQLIVVDKENK